MSNKKFSISDLEKFSGLKAHTIRVWEQRHKAFKPCRNNGIRFYDVTDLSKILKLALLNKNGYRISSLSRFTPEEIDLKLQKLPTEQDHQDRILSQLFVHMYTLEPVLFEELVNTSLQVWDFDTVLKKIILPFLERTGLLWTGNRLSEEHFVVTVLRRKIIHGIETLAAPNNRLKKIMLFLPEGRQLDIGLLYTNYLLKQKGICVLYMGTDVSIKNLEQTLKATTPEIVFTYLPQKNNFDVDALATFMEQALPQSKLLIGQYQPNSLAGAFRTNHQFLHFEEAIKLMLCFKTEDFTQHNHVKPGRMFMSADTVHQYT